MAAAYHFSKKTITDIDVSGKRVLLRADFNVPLGERGNIDSDFRIRQTLPTLQYLLKQKATIIITAHLGRPDGKPDASASLQPVAKCLAQLLDHPVEFVSDCIGDGPRQAVKKAKPGSVLLLENVRFHPGEEANDPAFAKALVAAAQPDYIVQDGFGVVHRAHASTEGVSHLKPAVAGLLLAKEVTRLSAAIDHPQKPLVAVIGGAKISDKLPLIERFLSVADTILVGGALANTFLKQAGVEIGKSLYEPHQEDEVDRILKKARPGQILLPVDVAVASKVDIHAARHESKLDHIHPNESILDLGPVTTDLFTHVIAEAATVIWNGTLGYAENPRFAKSSAAVAQTLASHYPSLTSIIGGGDTADFVLDWQTHNKNAQFSHISTGGGASLELLSGKKLPGVETLLNA